MLTFAIALAAALLFGVGVGILAVCGYLATLRIQRAVMRDRAADLAGMPAPGAWDRVWAWAMRRLVHWLRRHRHAAMAGRIRALEIELGMVEPEPGPAELRLRLLADHTTRSVAEIREILTHPDQIAEAFATRESTEKLLADYRRSFFANSVTPAARRVKHPPYATSLHDWDGDEQCPQCVRMLDIARLTARTSE